jgi:hypothetical protein
LEGLVQGRADRDGRGSIDVDELYNYASQRVPELVKQAGKSIMGNPATQTPVLKNRIGNITLFVR